MKIGFLRINNFRGIRQLDISFGNSNHLVGINGIGKTTVLEAIDIFFKPTYRFTEEDFCEKDLTAPITIAITFTSLWPTELERFKQYLDENNHLEIILSVVSDNDEIAGKWHGVRTQHIGFKDIREAGNFNASRALYNEIKEQTKYSHLGTVRTKEDLEASLTLWESMHPEECERVKDGGQFFGYKQVGLGYLHQSIRPIRISALSQDVKIISGDGRTFLSDIVNGTVRNVEILTQEIREQLENQKSTIDKDFRIRSTNERERMTRLIEGNLSKFCPTAKIGVEIEVDEFFTEPKFRAELEIQEHHTFSTTNYCGSGMLRLCTLAVILSVHQMESEISLASNERGRTLLLLIDEPELFQHPQRLKMMGEVLKKISDGTRDSNTQSIVSTHSAYMVDLGEFSSIRLFRQEDEQIVISQATISEVTEIAGKVFNIREPVDAYTISRLSSIGSLELQGGLFAEKIILVEGAEDKGIVEAALEFIMPIGERVQYEVLACGGKTNMDLFYIIFSLLGLPCYMIWDSDSKKGGEQYNIKLLKFLGVPDGNYTESAINPKYACWSDDFQLSLRDDIGRDIIDAAFMDLAKDWGTNKDKIEKRRMATQIVYGKMLAEGKSGGLLEKLIENVRLLERDNIRERFASK